MNDTAARAAERLDAQGWTREYNPEDRGIIAAIIREETAADVAELVAALGEIRELTASRQLPLTIQVNDVADATLRTWAASHGR